MIEKLTGRRNPLAVHIKKLGADKSYREQRREFLCDGLKLLEEAVGSNAQIIDVLTASYIPFPLPVGAKVYQAPRDVIDSLSPLKNAQDTLFTCAMPPSGGFTLGDGFYILLDGIQDPGNLGTILRTAEAFRCAGVIMTGNCADIYNPKTIRATMGAVFRQKTYRMSLHELTALKESGAAFAGAAPGAGHKAIQDVRLNDRIIAVGSEGRGLSDGVLSLCGEVFTIPIAPECESLNAAAAASIIIWEAGRTR